jgi:uncharacterized protein YdeI (YjbR/CyaY-like superfamily)
MALLHSAYACGVADDLPELTVPDAAAWRAWLADNHDGEDGIWVILAKKGTTEPTTLAYEQAVEEALCYGWIDGLTRSRDEGTYRQRYTPRRARSNWSQSNITRVERLIADGRMRPAGFAAIERAKAEGRLADDDVHGVPPARS